MSTTGPVFTYAFSWLLEAAGNQIVSFNSTVVVPPSPGLPVTAAPSPSTSAGPAAAAAGPVVPAHRQWCPATRPGVRPKVQPGQPQQWRPRVHRRLHQRRVLQHVWHLPGLFRRLRGPADGREPGRPHPPRHGPRRQRLDPDRHPHRGRRWPVPATLPRRIRHPDPARLPGHLLQGHAGPEAAMGRVGHGAVGRRPHPVEPVRLRRRHRPRQARAVLLQLLPPAGPAVRLLLWYSLLSGQDHLPGRRLRLRSNGHPTEPYHPAGKRKARLHPPVRSDLVALIIAVRFVVRFVLHVRPGLVGLVIRISVPSLFLLRHRVHLLRPYLWLCTVGLASTRYHGRGSCCGSCFAACVLRRTSRTGRFNFNSMAILF